MLVGQFAAQQLIKSNVIELEQSTKQVKVNFVPLDSIKNPATARLG